MENLEKLIYDLYKKNARQCTNEEIYNALLIYTKNQLFEKGYHNGKKKIYYISAEFLIGKLLSNNLINLGLYEETEKVLKSHGYELCEIEELEMEPSLGNGGLGRLAACFLDSIATLGLPGDGIGLNYHFGLFQQKFTNHKQQELKNPWITKESWLNRQSFTCKVPFKDFTMDGVLYDIDVPGYDKIELHPAARFIGTMNYGYAGTKELNEALVSRFLVIQMPDQNEETLEKIFTTSFPEGKPEAIEQFIGLFLDLQKKAENGEISTKALDLRGILASLRAIRQGLKPSLAVRMGVINKCFDGFEKEIVEDVVMTRIPEEWTTAQVF